MENCPNYLPIHFKPRCKNLTAVLHVEQVLLSDPVPILASVTQGLNKDMLPDYIHMRVAESVLFAGKAIRVLRNPSPAFKYRDVVSHHQISRETHKIQGFTGRFALQKEPSVDKKMIGEELLPQSEADKIDAMLQELKCFLEESRHLMRLPPRQSTAESDLMVPFQLGSLLMFFASLSSSLCFYAAISFLLAPSSWKMHTFDF
ncbi:hypothetical protein IFM89_016909 [Coptis chinensis]|uniref:Uncharacterized protein n=1 Tax=Coptis chinensis TaxID=261450 RepID=A0A835LVB1_9MAGN|nr:hypothetical protein IFM89_016909 [Coptis chinensis]